MIFKPKGDNGFDDVDPISVFCCYQVIAGRDVPKPSRLGPSSLKIEGLEKHQPTNILVGG